MATMHDELQVKGVVWMRGQGFPLVVPEAKALASSEIPDVFGADYKGRIMIIEVKANRKDFLADKKKPFRLSPELGVGDRRYYAAPKGVLKPEDLPAGWGLLEPHGKGLRIVVKSSVFREQNRKAENAILVSICRFRRDEAVANGYGTEVRKRRTVGKRRKGV